MGVRTRRFCEKGLADGSCCFDEEGRDEVDLDGNVRDHIYPNFKCLFFL